MKWPNGEKVTAEVVANALPAGWKRLAERLIEDLEAMGWDGTVFQAKEKFAELRFYTGDADELVSQRIDEAVEESATSCQVCGSPGGPVVTHGWISVLCEDHGGPES